MNSRVPTLDRSQSIASLVTGCSDGASVVVGEAWIVRWLEAIVAAAVSGRCKGVEHVNFVWSQGPLEKLFA